ncbi:MAG: hypothetical protein GAK29_02192 [Acinetobacter bereziniae]|uniref:Uncharacterized protein n=1 Tax=Acinetobacter bereziniae TaxID=106648 RepID=A0A833PGB7_ACIBZ|nr:MAG: hypothetical protein GAK29_02192 [Acinetobacter bereziniae]
MDINKEILNEIERFEQCGTHLDVESFVSNLKEILSTPDGFVLVLKQPTNGIILKGCREVADCTSTEEMERAYKAMIEAQTQIKEFKNALLKEATPEVLNAPARVGGVVFREGVKWKTVIESAQRLYEQSKSEIKPIVSPADMLKIASGELVLMPKELPEEIAKSMALERVEMHRSETDPTWIKISEDAYKGQLQRKKLELRRDYKAMIEAQEQSHD